jgi:hypothetical protein
VARHLLFWGAPTNVGHVTTIRTLEKQIRRLRAEPELGRLMEATPPWVEDPLRR